MYQYRRFDHEDRELLKNMTEWLALATDEGMAEGEFRLLALDENNAVGAVFASGEPEKVTLRIVSVKTRDLTADKFAEVLEYLLRILIVEARMAGDWERVVIAPPEDLKELIEDRGFIEDDDVNCPGLEYYLNECMGYCPLCRRC